MSEKQFIFYPDSLTVEYSNGKERIIPYSNLEYIQEKEGLDFFYANAQRNSKMFIISKNQVTNKDSYQEFLAQIKHNKIKEKNIMRFLNRFFWNV